MKKSLFTMCTVCVLVLFSCSMNNGPLAGEISGESETGVNPEVIVFEENGSQNIITGPEALFENADRQSSPLSGFVLSEDRTNRSENLAFGKTAKALSIYADVFNASKAVDANVTTAWGSATSPDIQWIYIDLGDVYDVGSVVLKWYDIYYARSYQLGYSIDGKNWTVLDSINGDGGTDTLTYQAVGPSG